MAIPGWPAKRVEEDVGDYLVRQAAGEGDESIRASMSLSHGKFRQLKREALAQEKARRSGQNAEDLYLEYCMKQDRLVVRLSAMADDFKAAGQPAQQVAAVKAISDILDRKIKVGQDMGVIEKAPERSVVAHGVLYAEMNAPDLRRVIATLASEAAALTARYGTSNIVDVDFGVSHYQLPSRPARGADKHNRSPTAKVAAGRRPKVAKQKAL